MRTLLVLHLVLHTVVVGVIVRMKGVSRICVEAEKEDMVENVRLRSYVT